MAGDFIPINLNFTSIFDQLPNQDSGVVNISNVDTIENAVNKVKTALNMMPLDGSDYVPSDITSHTLKLLGKDVWGGKVGASIRLASTGGKIVAKVEAKLKQRILQTLSSVVYISFDFVLYKYILSYFSF